MTRLKRIVKAARARIPIMTCRSCGKDYTGSRCWNCG